MTRALASNGSETLRKAARRLPRIYSDPERYDVLARLTAPADLPFYGALAKEQGGPVLELGSGTGRLAIEIARLGYEVTGLELSPSMLEFATRKARRMRADVRFVHGDLRRFNLDRTFPLVLLPYNTLNHLIDLVSLRRAFAAVRRHMGAGSRFVIDTFQPSLALLGANPGARGPILRYADPRTGADVVLFEENLYEPATQLNRIVWSYEIGGRPDARTEEMTMRLFFPAELDALLALEGFATEAKYGDYDRRPFGSTSSKQLFVCRLA